MRERSINLKKEQIENFEEVKEANRRMYISKRKHNHRSDYFNKQIKKRWEHEDALRANKRQKMGLA